MIMLAFWLELDTRAVLDISVGRCLNRHGYWGVFILVWADTSLYNCWYWRIYYKLDVWILFLSDMEIDKWNIVAFPCILA